MNDIIEIRLRKRYSTAIGNLTIKKNPASVNITDERIIPVEYIKEK